MSIEIITAFLKITRTEQFRLSNDSRYISNGRTSVHNNNNNKKSHIQRPANLSASWYPPPHPYSTHLSLQPPPPTSNPVQDTSPSSPSSTILRRQPHHHPLRPHLAILFCHLPRHHRRQRSLPRLQHPSRPPCRTRLCMSMIPSSRIRSSNRRATRLQRPQETGAHIPHADPNNLMKISQVTRTRTANTEFLTAMQNHIFSIPNNAWSSNGDEIAMNGFGWYA